MFKRFCEKAGVPQVRVQASFVRHAVVHEGRSGRDSSEDTPAQFDHRDDRDLPGGDRGGEARRADSMDTLFDASDDTAI
ncbi:hypothetical protein [Nocardia gipuzkoensis]